MRPILIGLTGRARSGKTTAAEHLARTYLLEQYAFADPLRDGLMAIFNLDPTDFEGDRKEQTLGWLDCSPRQLMQSMGTEWARNTVHPDVWVKLAEQNLEYMTKAMGAVLAQEAPANADVVVPVPDSGVPAALGYAQASGIPFELGIIRNHYVGRTFIEPTQKVRARLEMILQQTGADELIFTGDFYEPADRLRSFEIVAGLRS